MMMSTQTGWAVPAHSGSIPPPPAPRSGQANAGYTSARAHAWRAVEPGCRAHATHGHLYSTRSVLVLNGVSTMPAVQGPIVVPTYWPGALSPLGVLWAER